MSWDTVAETVKSGIGNNKKAIFFCVNIQPFDPTNTKDQNHSGLLIYDKNEGTLSFYDPFGNEMGDDADLKKVLKKDYYNKKQREKYHTIFQKIATKMKCRFVSSRDVHNEQEMVSFTDLFKHRFRRVDGYGQHTPHMSITYLERVLCIGGRATNIYEMSEMCMEVNEFQKYLKEDFYPYMEMMDGKVYRNPGTCFDLGEEKTAELKALVLRRIHERVDKGGFVEVEYSVMRDLETYSLWNLQKVLKALLYEPQFPPNMLATIGWNKRSWREESMLELVVQRIEPNYYLDRFYDEEQKGKMSGLVDAIKADISAGFVFGARMKYKRLMRALKDLEV